MHDDSAPSYLLASRLAPVGLDAPIAEADAESSRPDTWGTSFMVVQAHVQLPT